MAKELILMADVEGLGAEGEVVRVANGFARNCLVPQGKAAFVTPGTKRLVEKKKAERAAREAEAKEVAQKLADQLASITVTLSVKAGEKDKLFGSVTATDVLGALEKQGIKLDKKQLLLEAPLRELGSVEVPVKLHADVDAKVSVNVVAE